MNDFELRERTRRAFEDARDLAPRHDFAGRVRASLDATHRRQRPVWGIGVRQGAIAAALLLTIASGLFAYRCRDWLMTTGALARAVVGDHHDCALLRQMAATSISLDEATRKYGGGSYRVLEHMPASVVMTTIGPAHIVRRHACLYNGQRFAHVVFDYRGELVSLLVTAADGRSLALPGETAPHVTRPNRIDRTSIVSFRTDRYSVFLAGNIAPADLSALADAVAGPLYRELAGA
jgi:hypothetical protein